MLGRLGGQPLVAVVGPSGAGKSSLVRAGVIPALKRAAFVAGLAGVGDDASSPLRLVLALRSDFLDRAAEDRPFAAEVIRGLLLLAPMGPEGLAAALTRPLEAVGYRFEDEGTARAMLAALATARSPLPILQFTAAQLWEGRDRDRRLLTRASYERLGGVAGALSAHADAVLAALPPPEQALCRGLMLRLVTPERTRAVVSLGELRASSPHAGAVEPVVQRLADARLLLVEPSAGPEDATVELVHESLIDRWGRLAQWLDESQHEAPFPRPAARRGRRVGGERRGPGAALARSRRRGRPRLARALARRAARRPGRRARRARGALLAGGRRPERAGAAPASSRPRSAPTAGASPAPRSTRRRASGAI